MSFDADASFAALRRLDRFRAVAAEHLAGVPRPLIALWSLADVDALMSAALVHELCHDESLVVLDVGTFLGASAVHFAGLDAVRHVVSVDPNPKVADEIRDKAAELDLDEWTVEADARTLDAARAIVARFPDEDAKIDLVAGYVGASELALSGEQAAGERTEVPSPSAHGADRLLAFVDGLHTAAGVRADLEAVFAAQPDAVALVDDCRYVWGLEVQSGIAAFIAGAGDHRFRLLADLAPAGATTSLGLVYGPDSAALVEPALEGVAGSLSRLLDPLVLLRRNEELVAQLNVLHAERGYAVDPILKFRYAIADAVFEQTLQVAAVRRSLLSLGRRILSAGQ